MMNGGSSANPAPNLGSAFPGSYAGYVNRNSTGALYYGSHVTFQSLIVHLYATKHTEVHRKTQLEPKGT